jgi:regulator of replication initiation timing
MNKEQFFQWMNDPASLDPESVAALNQLTDDYPYFQTARLLHVLSLKRVHDYRFEPELRQVSAYVPDRSKLREWIGKIEEIEATGESRIVKEEITLPPVIEPEENTQLKELEEQIRQGLMEIERKKLKLRELIEEKKAITGESGQLIEEIAGERKETPMRPLPKDDLLDEFIREAGKQVPKRVRFYSPDESARRSIEENEGIISETLARLVAAQGKKDKAIEIYQKLMLNNPQKSSYFAAQIEKLRKES